ncbi:hypothetical protein MYU51_008689 [Penicillium brevicompactum]
MPGEEVNEAPAAVAVAAESHQPAKDIIYPSPQYGAFGDQEGSPEYWAHRAGNAPWGRCHNAAKSKNSLLERMMAMPLLREPKLQLNSKNNKRKIVDGLSFNSQLGQSLHAAEALLAHSVGEKLPAEGACLSCQKRDGKFVSCVKVPGKDHCSNCHWYRRVERCQSEAGGEGLPQKPNKKRKAHPEQRPEEERGKAKRQALEKLNILIASMEENVARVRDSLRAEEENLEALKVYREEKLAEEET